MSADAGLPGEWPRSAAEAVEYGRRRAAEGFAVGYETRAERAERAALGAVVQVNALMEAIRALFKSARSDDPEVYGRAVDGLKAAYDDARAWAESERRNVRR